MLHRLIQSMNPVKTMLIAGSLIFSCVLIILNNINVLPLALGDFIFFSSIVFLLALYRPGWAFLFFIGLLPFEIVNMAPQEIGLMLRPYQWVGILTLGAVIIRYVAGRLSFSLPKIHRLDWLLLVLWFGSFITALSAPDKTLNLKQSLVLLSFIALYALVRIFIRTVLDVTNTIPFFIGSSVVVSLYALWQNIRFANGSAAFEVMAGRPNSVFTEPDWLGIFLVVYIAVLYMIIVYIRKAPRIENITIRLSGRTVTLDTTLHRLRVSVWYGLLTLAYVTLILSVSRSAWLSVAVLSVVAWCLVLTDGVLLTVAQWKWRESILYATGIVLTGVASLLLVLVFHLTSFQLFNRAQSTASGLQLITIACEKETVLPDKIASTDELAQYHCRHINLEDKESAVQGGEVVTEVYRSDPNVTIRKDIYTKTITIIREHSLKGIGFGSIHSVLGDDERGTGLNASNMFLEVWLGSGALGLLAFVFVWLSIGIIAGKRLLVPFKNNEYTAIYLFIFLSWIGLMIFNLFNAGIFLGFFWVWLGVAVGFTQKKE